MICFKYVLMCQKYLAFILHLFSIPKDCDLLSGGCFDQIERTKDSGFEKQLRSLQDFWFIRFSCFQQICLAFHARRLIESSEN